MRLTLSVELLATAALGFALIALATPRLVAAIAGPAATGSPAGKMTRQTLEARLSRAPADPAGWAALAQLDLAETGPSGPAPRALALSLLTGPNEPDLLWQRVELGLALWQSLGEGDRGLMGTQFRRAWVQDPARLVGLARRAGGADPVRAALGDDPAAAARFNGLLAGP
jgi:hypothetical protein